MHRGRYEKQLWPGNPAGQTKSERQPARYEVYVPETLADYDPVVPAALSKLLSEADSAVEKLNRLEPSNARQIETLARQLLRQESLASSRIEGLSLSHKRIGEAAYSLEGSADIEAKAVLANIEAMSQAIAIGTDTASISRDTILELHETLMRSTKPEIAGRIREKQNWVGGSWHTPIGAEFVPPPWTVAADLLADLAAFMNRTDLPPTLQAALTHAQFETIHPFADGNGRIGRCLIHVVYRRRGVADHQVPPVSLVLATDVDAYTKALTAYRKDAENDWVSYFAQVVCAASEAGATLGDRLAELQQGWREQALPRAGSTADRLIDLLPIQPVLDVQMAAELAGTSNEAARLALNSLEKHGVVARATGKRNWGRVWEARGLWNLLDRFEERLATPDGQPRSTRPAPRTRG
jgi:Fic family protein